MRKTFKLFCAAALAVLAVSSCGKIWDEFDAVHDELDGLETRIAELETKLNDQVAAINSTIGALDAKVAVTKVEKNDAGNYVLTFSNGETLEVSAADANANNTGLVTTVTENGVTYWAVVGKDGKAVKLDAVVHPDTKLSFKVDPETNVLLVSYDGTNYESTGVVVNDETTFNVVEKFVDAEGYVVLTVGGVEYKLPKVSANYFEIVTGMQYFAPAQTKTLVVNMDGVISSMIASTPAGWSAKLTEKEGLKITAPAGEYDDFWGEFYPENMTDEASGEVVVWVVTEDGETKVGTVNVAIAGTPATFTFDKTFEKVSVAFSTSYEGAVYFGVCKADEYDVDAVLAKVAASSKACAEGIFTNFDYELGNQASEDEYKFSELLGAAPEVGVPYVFWSVAPSVSVDYETYESTLSAKAEDIVLDYVTVYTVTVKDPVVAFNDATLDVVVAGADEFYIGYAYGTADLYFGEYGTFSEEMLAYYAEMGVDFKSLLIEGMPSMGGWGPSVNQMVTFGGVFEGEYKGKVTELYKDTQFNPGDVFTVFVLPLLDGKLEYTAEDLTYVEVELPELKLGGEATVTFGDATDVKYNSFKLPVEATGERTYYTVVDAETYEYAKEMLVDGVLDNISRYTAKDAKSFVLEVKEDWQGMSLQPKTKYVVLAFSVAADASCGDVVTTEVTTGDLPYSDALAVTAIAASAANEQATATFTITGAATKIYYRLCVTSYMPAEEDYANEALDALSGESWSWYSKDLTADNFKDGKVTIADPEGMYVGNAYDRVIFAFVADKDGNISKIAKSETFHDATQEVAE